MPGTGHTIGSMGLIVLHPKVPPIASTAQSDRVLQVHPFPTYPPHSASSLALSARATFLCPVTRPNSSFVSHQAACSAPHLPMSSFVWTLASINPSKPAPRPLRYRSCTGRASFICDQLSPLRGGCPIGMRQSLGSKTTCCAPAERCGTAQYFGQKRETEQSQMK